MDIKLLKCADPDSGLGHELRAEVPVFVSAVLGPDRTCRTCGVALRPQVYLPGRTVRSPHRSADCIGMLHEHTTPSELVPFLAALGRLFKREITSILIGRAECEGPEACCGVGTAFTGNDLAVRCYLCGLEASPTIHGQWRYYRKPTPWYMQPICLPCDDAGRVPHWLRPTPWVLTLDRGFPHWRVVPR